jgi:dipeptidyl aminopeptidase/acylaminoacyl peptidase
MRKSCSIALLAIGILALTGAAAEPGTLQASVEPPVHRYLDVRISPDATRVVSVEGDQPVGGFAPDVRDLVIRPVKGGAPVQIALPCGRVPQCWAGSPAWSPDSKHLSFTLRAPGSHRYAVYTVAPDGSGLHKLLDFGGTLGALKYAPDGTLAMLAVENARKEVGATEAGAQSTGDLDAASPEQRIGVLEGESLRWASPAGLFVYEYDWLPSAQGFVGTAAPGDGDNNWWLAKLYAFTRADGAAKLLYTPANLEQQIATPRVSPDGRTVAFIAGIMSDFGSTGGDLYSLPLDGSAAINLTPDLKSSATALEWSCEGKLLAELLTGDQIQIVEAGTGSAPGTLRTLVSSPEQLGFGRESSTCFKGVQASAHESFTAPPEIEVGPLGKARNITSANARIRAAVRPVSVTWSIDGFEEQGWLLLPPASQGKIPLITVVHGGPASATLPRFQGAGLQTRLLERGWGVFLPNPRGSFGRGERFTRANIKDFGHGDLRDILAGIDAAERIAPIDESRLGLTGGSYGGFMTMWAVTQTHRFKAAVAAAGISNWQSYYGENGIDQWMLPYFGASVYDDPNVYARSSPIHFIRNVRTPTFVYVGERDIECPAPQTQEFWHALNALGVPTSIAIYPGEGHGLREPDHSADALQRTLAWFDKYLR